VLQQAVLDPRLEVLPAFAVRRSFGQLEGCAEAGFAPILLSACS